MAGATARKGVEHLKALAISFSVAALATTQFIRHARHSPDIVSLTPAVTVLSLVVLIVLPAVAVFAADRALAIRDPSGRAVRRLRTIVYAVAIVLVARQLFLYFGPVSDAIGPLTSHVVLSVAVAVLTIVAAVWLARRGYEQFSQFFTWMALPALLMVAVVADDITHGPRPSGYANETPVPSDEAPVFIFVFDELSYAVLADGPQIDAEAYPNLATIADDGAWFTNATTNYFHTTFVVPKLFAGASALTGDYQVRLYGQYGYVESLMYDGCGVEYTCRGQAHLASQNTGALFGDLLVRTAYQAAPDFLDFALNPPIAAATDALGTAPPSADRLGIHTFTEEQWDEFMGDVGAERSAGRAYFVHLLLPHEPFVFGEDGSVVSSGEDVTFYDGDAEPAAVYERYSEQTRYLDSLMGEFLARLKDEGLYDEATIIITGDHGLRRESLKSELPIEMTTETAQVPLIIKAPGIRPQTVNVDYQHVDFAATLLEALGREPPAGLDGVSAFAADRPQRDKVVYVDEQNERFWEYVYHPADDTWELARAVEGPLPETPQFVRSAVGD